MSGVAGSRTQVQTTRLKNSYTCFLGLPSWTTIHHLMYVKERSVLRTKKLSSVLDCVQGSNLPGNYYAANLCELLRATIEITFELSIIVLLFQGITTCMEFNLAFSLSKPVYPMFLSFVKTFTRLYFFDTLNPKWIIIVKTRIYFKFSISLLYISFE